MNIFSVKRLLEVLILSVILASLSLSIAFSFTYEEQYVFCTILNMTIPECLGYWDVNCTEASNCTNTTIWVLKPCEECEDYEEWYEECESELEKYLGERCPSCDNCNSTIAWQTVKLKHEEEMARIERGCPLCEDCTIPSGYMTSAECELKISEAVVSSRSSVQTPYSVASSGNGKKSYFPYILIGLIAVLGIVFYVKYKDKLKGQFKSESPPPDISFIPKELQETPKDKDEKKIEDPIR